MKLNIKRPLVVFDLETTGTNPQKDRIVELSMLKVYPEGREEVYTKRVNPGVHIPEAVVAVHGISDEDVKDCPTIGAIAAEVADFLRNSDLAGFNAARFDLPMLAEELMRGGVDVSFLHEADLIDVQTIYHKMEPRNLTAAYRHYCGKELEGAHGAEADTRATYEVLLGQIQRYGEALPTEVSKLADFSNYKTKTVDFAGYLAYDGKGDVVLTFGKNKGKTLAELFERELGYYEWMLSSDLPRDTKLQLKAAYAAYLDKLSQG